MTRSIYIVDDDTEVRASLQTFLSLRGDMIVRGYRSGEQFLAEAARLNSGVLLLDFHMPGANGLEVLAELRQIAPTSFGAIILTGEANVTLAVQAMKAGALDFIEKPYAASVLLEIIDGVFARLEKQSVVVERAAKARTQIGALSPREREVLFGLIEGRANKVIAHQLDISPRTVEVYRANLMTKLAVRSLPEALRIAFAAGLVSPG